MCDNCEHKPVCSIYRATGGVKSCEHHKEERKGKWEQIGFDKAMDRITCTCCLEYWNITDNDTETFNYCPNCGADMRGMPSSGPAGHFPQGEGFGGVDTDPSGAIRRTGTEVDNEQLGEGCG